MGVDLQVVQLGLGVLGAIGVLAAGAWALVKAFGLLVKTVVTQFDARLDERFKALEASREEGRKAWDARHTRMEAKQEQIDRELRQLLIEMPDKYVRREDYVRRETVIEGKIDQLRLQIQNWILESKHA